MALSSTWLIRLKLGILCFAIGAFTSSCVFHHELASYPQGQAIEKEAANTANNILPTFMRRWNIHEFLIQASPELLSNVTPRMAQVYFKFLSKHLGALKHYNGVVGKVDILKTSQGAAFIGSYQGKATFEKGNAEINVKLIQHQHQWKVLYFSANSKEIREAHPPLQSLGSGLFQGKLS